jgi:hypothetical protein
LVNLTGETNGPKDTVLLYLERKCHHLKKQVRQSGLDCYDQTTKMRKNIQPSHHASICSMAVCRVLCVGQASAMQGPGERQRAENIEGHRVLSHSTR